jgi:TP901 family phage tail tape measure protein
MARTSATISVGADTRQLERDIQSALARDFKFKGLNEKAFTQPLGRITGASNEFQKSLDASNARVIAFGASAGLIYGVEKAFSSLIRSTIDVQKSLTDINVILNVSTKSLNTFGSGLFDIAKSTGQSFDAVAKAATEFSRQGLGLEATLKRTKDALILTRLSGLDTVASVEALTATINSFSDAALDSTTIINKLANVDAAFAVSSADLAEAIKRVGSSAQDAGVDFDELLAIVTSVQQTTARGGAVIGNSLKTIFTRIQRTDTLDQLEQLGIQVRTLEGNTLPAIQILSNLSSTFGTLGDAQRAQVAETVGGVFQINILKAALADLGKEYSVYNNALKTSSSATDQAITRNEALNQTLSSLINKTFVNLTKVGSDLGKVSFGPSIENLLNLLNKGLESIDVDGGGIGNKIAKGIFEQIGAFISGPGIVLLTAVVAKLVFNLGKFAAQSLQVLLNLNTKSEERAAIQAKINQVLSQEPALVQAIYNKEITVLDVENKILAIIRQQTLERQRAASLSSTLTTGLIGKGLSAKGGVLKAKSAGFIPNFASSEILGALAGGYDPGYVRKMNIPGEGSVTYNSAEKVKKFPGMDQPAIMPPQGSKAGKNYQSQFDSVYGFNPYASSGFIPNFSAISPAVQAAITKALSKGDIRSLTSNSTFTNRLTEAESTAVNLAKQKILAGRASTKNPTKITKSFNAETLGVLSLRGKSGDVPTSTSLATLPMFSNAVRADPSIGQNMVQFNGVQVRSLDALDKQKPNEFIKLLTEQLLPPLANVATQFVGSALGNQGDGVNEVLGKIKNGKSFLPPGAIGDLFETVVKIATKNPGKFIQSVDDDFRRPFDFEEAGAASGQFKSRFGFKSNLIKADAKLTSDSTAIRSIIKKAYNSNIPGLPFTELLSGKIPKTSSKKSKSKGFIPNFSALNDSINREIMAGTSPSRVRIGKDSRLTSASNPLGLGVYNTKDEPLGLSQGVSRAGSKAKTAGAANGFVPNFVLPAAAVGGAILGNTVIRFAVQQAISAALIFGINKIVETVNSRIEDDKNKQIVSTVGQAAQFGIGTALLGGGAKVGAGIALSTLIPGLINALTSTDQTIKDLIVASEENKDKIEEFNSAFSSYSSNLEKLKDENISSGEKQKILSQNNEQLSKILLNTPENLRESLAKTLSTGDFEKITEGLSQVQTALQVQSANTQNLANVLEITSDKKVTQAESSKLVSSILGVQNERGMSLAGSVMNNPRILENFQKNLNESLGKEGINVSNRDLTDAVEKRFGYRTNMEGDTGYANQGRVSPFAPQEIDKKELNRLKSIVAPDVFKQKQKEFEEKSQNIVINSIEQLFKDAEISQNTIDSIIQPLRGLPFDETSTQAQALNQALGLLGLTVKKTDKGLEVLLKYTREDLLRRAGLAGDVSSNIASADAFRKNIDVKSLQEYSKEVLDRDLNLNANRIATTRVLDAQQQIYSSILNETERRKVNAKFIEQINNLHKKGVIDLDKFTLAVQGGQEELVALNQRARGLMFAEDFRGARQAAREKRILGGDAKIEDIPAAFFDEFDNRTEDSYRQAQLGAADTARTIKSEFNNAFLSFANGTETASDAFTKMALNISDRIQQLALEFATNQVFGSLFGSTSSIFGGSGGIGDFFSSLFKSKGGMIKGYSSGGNVTGGSGTKDDVPAMLSGGEYVIRKSAVKKYGPEYLQMLNEGKVEKRFLGGAIGLAMAALAQGAKTNPGAASMLPGIATAFGFPMGQKSMMGTSQQSMKVALGQSGGVNPREYEKFAGGGEVGFLGKNFYKYNDPLYPTGGESVISENLSLMAILDEDNPQNAIRKERETTLFNYLIYLKDLKERNEEAYKENQRLNKEIRDNYNRQQNQKQTGSLLTFGLGVAGSLAPGFMPGGKDSFFGKSSTPNMPLRKPYTPPSQNNNYPPDARGRLKLGKASGGQIKKFAAGGSNVDDIPALLMAGEFVIKKDIVNMYGKQFFDDLNRGRIKKFAEGGPVGNSSSSSSVPASNPSAYSPVNNINITVNVAKEQSQVVSQNQNSSASEEDAKEETVKNKDLAEKIKGQVIRVLTEQQRPGGMLSSSIYKKR